MTESLAEVGRVIQAVGEFVGRTKLQKIVYIAQRLGYPFRQSFSWHIFGPFSPQLAAQVAEMEKLGLVSQEATREGRYRSSKYQLTDVGEQFLDLFEDRADEPDTLAHLVRELHKKRSARELELIASILYFEELGDDRSTAMRKALSAKPKFKGQPQKVMQALEDLAILTKHLPAR